MDISIHILYSGQRNKKANHAHILNDWLMKICCFQLAPVMGLDFPDSFIKIGKYVSLFHCKIHTSKFFCSYIFLEVHPDSTLSTTFVSMAT